MADTCCWICLEDEGSLTQPCACPRHVHQKCLARWQLQKSGSDEEHWCRFCMQPYGDWRDQLVAATDCSCIGDAQQQLSAPVELVVAVTGSVFRVMAMPGPLGKAALAWQITSRLGLPMVQDNLDISFLCTVPWSPEDKAWLCGIGAFDAAVRCATARAARRSLRQQGQGALRRCSKQRKPLQLLRQDCYDEEEEQRLRQLWQAGAPSLSASRTRSFQSRGAPEGSSSSLEQDVGVNADHDAAYVGSFPIRPVRRRVASGIPSVPAPGSGGFEGLARGAGGGASSATIAEHGHVIRQATGGPVQSHAGLLRARSSGHRATLLFRQLTCCIRRLVSRDSP